MILFFKGQKVSPSFWVARRGGGLYREAGVI